VASIEESIQANVETVLKTISVANGYGNNIGAVERWNQRGNSLASLPLLVACLEGTAKQDSPIGVDRWVSAIKIYVFVDHDPAVDSRSTDAVLTSLCDDVYRALYVDRTRGGYAEDTEVLGRSKVDPAPGQRQAVMVVFAEVSFRHATGTPGTA